MKLVPRHTYFLFKQTQFITFSYIVSPHSYAHICKLCNTKVQRTSYENKIFFPKLQTAPIKKHTRARKKKDKLLNLPYNPGPFFKDFFFFARGSIFFCLSVCLS